MDPFSGLFVANHPFCSRNFPFCSLSPLVGSALSALICLKNLERAAGIEPATYSLGSCRSTTELRPQNHYFIGISFKSTRKLVRLLSGACARPALGADAGQACNICRWNGHFVTIGTANHFRRMSASGRHTRSLTPYQRKHV